MSDKGRCTNQNIVYCGQITFNQPHYQNKVCFGITETSLKQDFTDCLKPFN